MHPRAKSLLLCLLGYQPSVWAATNAPAINTTGSLVKVALGLGVVLALMALLAWLSKRYLPGGTMQASVLKIVGSASVGSRERVVVLEIADRWIVVGVSPGQVNAIADLAIGAALPAATAKVADPNPSALPTGVSPLLQPMVKPFAAWLKHATDTIKTHIG